MKIIFNDASELQIQQITAEADGYLSIRTISATPDQLRAMFEDENKTRKLQAVDDRGSVLATYEGYTTFYRTEEYTGKIYGVTMYKPNRTPEATAAKIESAVIVAKYQAQDLPDDVALEVVNLYPEWSGDSTAYITGYKVQYNGILYKCLQDHTSQAEWDPESSASMWAKVLNPDPQIIPDWEQPGSTNGYSIGNKVRHLEKIWESLVDNNIWEPGAAGSEALWKEVIE